MSLPSKKSTSVEVNRYSFCRTRRQTVDAILEYLRNDFGMSLVRHLGNGSYGDVVQLQYQNKSNVAVKIVLRGQRHIGEYKLWPRLQHPNLLPLLNFKLIRPIHAMVYLTPLLSTDIFKFTSNINFQFRGDALQLMKMWLKSILMGLSYLHNENMCHLDLKSDNILLNDELQAIIADFSTLQSCEEPTNEYGTPVIYRPPEARRNATGVQLKAEGKSFDSWCVGMIAFELFTGNELARRVGRATNWVEEVYAELYHALQYSNFVNLVLRTLRSAEINKRTIDVMRNFVLMFLRINPKERPSAEEALQHEFLDTAYSTKMPDVVWRRGVSKEEMKDLIEKYDKINTVSQDAENAKTDYSNSNKHHLESKTPKNIPGFSGFRQERAAPITPLPNLLQDDHRLAATSRTLTSFEVSKKSSNVSGESEHKVEATTRGKMKPLPKRDFILDLPKRHDTRDSEFRYKGYNRDEFQVMPLRKFNKQPESSRKTSRGQAKHIAKNTRRLPHPIEEEHQSSVASRQPTPCKSSQSAQPSNGEPDPVAEATTARMQNPALQQIRGWWEKKIARIRKRLSRQSDK